MALVDWLKRGCHCAISWDDLSNQQSLLMIDDPHNIHVNEGKTIPSLFARRE